MNFISREFDLSKEKEIKAMEKMQQKLYKKYASVKIVQVGVDKFRILCSML